MLKPQPNEYVVSKVIRTIDGDTLVIDAVIFESTVFTEIKRFKLRLRGIDTPEMKGATRPAGEAAKVFLESLVARCESGGMLVRITSVVDSFGRVVGELLGKDDSVEGAGEVYNFGDRLLATGHAVQFRG